MNKKNVVTKQNISKVADFLKNACDYFKQDGEGCYHLNLTSDLALYVGWLGGYDMSDEDIIKSAQGITTRKYLDNNIEVGYAVNAGVKIRNDFDCSDYEYLNAPYYEDGDVYDTDVSLSPNMSRREYKRLARYFLNELVNMTNLLKKGAIKGDF